MEQATWETLCERLEERMVALATSGNQVSKKAGLGVSYVNDILEGNSKSPRFLAHVAEAMDCDVAYLLGQQAEPRGGVAVLNFPSGRKQDAGIPLFSTEWPDAAGFFAMHGGDAERVSPPFEGVSGGYAVIVPDDRMAPRYRAGELVFANPRRPVVPGAYVLLRTRDNRARIGEVLSIAADSVDVGCFSGDRRTFQRSEIATIHRITTSSES